MTKPKHTPLFTTDPDFGVDVAEGMVRVYGPKQALELAGQYARLAYNPSDKDFWQSVEGLLKAKVEPKP